MASGSEPRSLDFGGAQKAAALLLAMGSPLAARILKHFDAATLRQVTRAAADLGTVPLDLLETVAKEFSDAYISGPDVRGDVEQATAMLYSVPEIPASDIISGAFGVANANVWASVSRLPEILLAKFLSDERVETTTYILSRLEADAASRAIMLLDRRMRNRVLCDLIQPPVVSEAAALVIESTLRQELLTSDALQRENEHRARVAAIINNLDADEAAAALEALAGKKPEEVERLKSLLFTFSDLPKLSMRARALLFDKLPTDLVVMALRGTDDQFRNTTLSPMASRARRLVEGELASGADASARDVANARKEIARIVLEMAGRNEIEIAVDA